ncbi:MAG: ChbG/HpnK family deacetylase [Clostridia bacterium]|nr:ChbG/HpnK family deacetylase [Clostridia bacterium]
MSKLIITADDYGMCEAVNIAIEDCIKSKVVLSTNVMTNMAFCENATALKKKFSDLSIGIHYNLTAGIPLSPIDKIRTLVDEDGKFLSYDKIRQACKNKSYDYNQIRIELQAQYKRYVEICGEPDYWNTHQNVHVYPKLYELFRDTSLEFGIKKMRSHQRIYVPSSNGISDKSLKWTLTNPFKRIMLNNWQHNSAQKGVVSPDGLLVRMNEHDKLNLAYLFDNISWGKSSLAELIIHPSVSADGEFFGKVTHERVREYEVFSDSSVLDLAKRSNIEIVNFELNKL